MSSLRRKAIEAVRKYPDRFRIMGWFYLDDPQGRDLIAHWEERPGMAGLRFYFKHAPEPPSLSPRSN